MSIQKLTANYVVADSKSTAKNFATADSEIDSKTTSLPIQKSTAKNCVTADSEIGSKKLFCNRFRNWQQNYGTVDLEINSPLCHCQFKNWQPKPVPLLTQKLIAMLELFRLQFSLLLLFWVFTETQCLFEQIYESSYFTFDTFNFLLIMSLYLSPFFIFYLFSHSGVVNLR